MTRWLEELRDDWKFACRQLKNSPAFTLVATLTLALGIGANSAIFALVDATLLRPLPFGGPDRLVTIWEHSDKTARGYVSPLNMLDWNARSRTFEKIAGFTPSVGQMVMAGADGNAETISRQWVTAGIFDVLGITPIAGRTFSAEDEASRANVIVMSEGFWRTRYNADPSVIGHEIRLDGSLWTLIGIVPGDFQLLGQTSLWAMRPLVNLPPRARGAYMLQVAGRLKPGVSIKAAEADLGAVAEGLAREFPQTNKGRGVALERMHDSMIVLLLFGAGLLLRTLVAVEAFDRGYRAVSVLSMLVDPLGSKYPTAESLPQFYDQVEAEITAVPGVAGVAFASALPLDFFDSGGFSFEVVGDPPVDDSQRPGTEYQVVSPTYFSTLDLPILAGRAFDRRDTRDGVPVCIVNEAFARTFHGRSPIGQRVALRPASSPQAKPVVREIVGIARQVKGRPDEAKDFVQLYVPMAQDLSDDIFLVVRPKAGRAEALARAVRAAISRVDKEQLVGVTSVMTLEDIAWAATGRHRFRAVMVVAFATLALVLAMVGVFGMLAYSVQQRVRDFGVRRALGATTNDVLRLVIANAARVIATGTAIGLVVSAGVGRLIETMLFGVRPLDLTTFVFVIILLGITAALSIAGPAWRAARIEPAVALRNH